MNGGLPPLDVRIFLNEKPVAGLFELSKQLVGQPGKNYSEMQSVIEPKLINAKQGQKFRLKIEVSDRGENKWRDITLDRRLEVSNVMQRILFDAKKSEISISSSVTNNRTGFGIEALSIYYTENPEDSRAAYTEIYFDIKG